MSEKYDFHSIEEKWQKKWLEEKVFKAREDSSKPKYYQLETFPYPSAEGLHVGHPKGYIAEDIHARFQRMHGREVLYTMGWDAFGLPTENYAIKVGKSPKEVAEANVKNFKRQVQLFGFSYDWDREINTSSPEYYKWTQWLFIQLFKKGLAYRAKARVNWCPSCQTVLANEQVQGGVCERCESVVEQREMEQWFFKITDYADRLLNDLESAGRRSGLDWPEATIKRQKDWIGRSEGALLEFPIQDSKFKIQVFTTRPDTLFGATFMVLAPENSLVSILKDRIQNYTEVQEYHERTKYKSEFERGLLAREKTGIRLEGVTAINPGNKEEIPIYVSDFVLISYGTGAIMGVPGHDERDYEFARKFKLPIISVVEPKTQEAKELFMQMYDEDDSEVASEIRRFAIAKEYVTPTMRMYAAPLGKAREIVKILQNGKIGTSDEHKAIESGKGFVLEIDPPSISFLQVYTGDGVLLNSDKFSGVDSEKAKWEITKFVGGEKRIQYKLRDWSVSRQRYWGVPIPMVYCAKCALRDPSGQGLVPVPENELPVLLPDLEDYRPKGKPPLASSEKFINVKCPECGGEAKRDPETLDTFVDSSWYYLRYTDPHNENQPFDKDKAKHWLPVDLYVIGAEHTVLHLLYSRFITKFLHDIGYLKFQEPFLKLRHQGLILGADSRKMSKRWGNVVNPDDVIGQFGADTVRLYEMFMGPFESSQPWDPKGIVGVHRFLNRFWDYAQKVLTSPDFGKTDTPREKQSLIHKTIKKVEEDIASFGFNTAVSALMILLNGLTESGPFVVGRADFENILKIFNPFAPHLAQELWSRFGNKTYLDFEKWPEYDKKLVKEEAFTLVIQVNGKVRDSVEAPAEISEGAAKELALGRERIKQLIGGRKPERVVYVPGRLVNIVIKQ